MPQFTREGNDLVFALGTLTYLVHRFEPKPDGIRATISVRNGAALLHKDSLGLWSAKRRTEFAGRCHGVQVNEVTAHLCQIEEELRADLSRQERGKEQKILRAQTDLRGMDTSLLKIHAAQAELTSSNYSHDLLELSLADAISLPISEDDGSALVWLMAVGPPSSDKTETVLTVTDLPTVYRLDTLTENAFISGYVNPDGSEPKDLLAELGGKCLLVKDYTTLFSLREETVKKILGDLQSIYDGEFTKFMGTRGRVSHRARFSQVGCITPLALSVHHRYMAMIGGRFLFYRVLPLSEAERTEGFEIAWEQKGRRAKVSELRHLVSAYAYQLFQNPPPLEAETPQQQEQVNCLASLLAKGRSVVRSGKREFENLEGKMVSYYEMDEIQTEEPWRAFQQLRNLGRALARVHRRPRITDHELELLRRVVLSSMPVDRAEVLALFRERKHLTSDGGLTRKACQHGIGKSYGRAKQLLTELTAIRLLQPEKVEAKNVKEEYVYFPVTPFEGLIQKPLETLDHILNLGSEAITQNSPEAQAYVS